MDSLSQAVLGASVAGVCAPSGHRRKAMLAGAMLGTLPDLDVLIDFDDAVKNFTYHRGFSHSLFVLAPFSVVLWLLLRRWWAPVREAPRRWLVAISLALVTHPLLDAHTAYGTQLFWPLEVPPTMWSTLFIIDPAYTLPLLIGAIAAAIGATRPWSGKALSIGIALSTLYLGWSWIGKTMVEADARAVLADMGLADAPMFSTPAPFNTVLWRVVVMTADGYLEGYDSLLVNQRPINFKSFPSKNHLLDSAGDIWAVQRLRWFARDFNKVDVWDSRLVLTDLRMGGEPNYVFSHIVAEGVNPNWREIPTQQVMGRFSRSDLDTLRRKLWSD